MNVVVAYLRNCLIIYVERRRNPRRISVKHDRRSDRNSNRELPEYGSEAILLRHFSVSSVLSFFLNVRVYVLAPLRACVGSVLESRHTCRTVVSGCGCAFASSPARD
jgi:hypothetical protein